MPGTPDDRFGGETSSEILTLVDTAADPIEIGEIRNNAGILKARDGTGVFNLRTGGSGITEAQHKALRQLIHFIDDGPAEGFASGAYRETFGGVFPTSIVWWESAAMLKKIVRKTITRSGGGATNVAPTPIVWEMFATDGTTVIATVSDAVAYSGAFETSRTRTIS